VKPGAYLFLPLVGSTSVRDLVGLGLDRAFVPTIVGKPFNRPAYAIPAGVIDSLNDRIEIDAQLAELRKASDPYTASRELYLKQRADEVAGLCGKRKNTNAPPLP
jgi:phospholipid-binding lipoprotein MlaA